MPENQTGLKTEEKNRLKDQARNFLDSRFFYAAVDMYRRVLAIDLNDRDSHLGVLMGNASANSEEELIRYYQNKYSDSHTEKRYACIIDEETIERLCDAYWLEGYLSKEEISRLCRFDLSYDSHLSARISQRNGFAELITKDEDLSWLDKNDSAFISRILGMFDKQIEDAKKEDELNAALIKEEYRRFLKEAEAKAKVLNFEAREKREQDLSILVDEYEKSQELEGLNELIKKFEAFKGFKDANEYIELCKNKIKTLIDKKNNKPSVAQMNELFSYAKKALEESRFSDAYDAYMDISLVDPQSEKVHLGLLKAKHKISEDGELFDYFKNLYNENQKELIEACEEDRNHIEEMARKYMLPGYLEKEEILAEYLFDRNCESSLNNRLEEQKRFKETIASDVSFRWLETNGSEKVKQEIASVYKTYQDRVDEAEEEERKNKEEVSNAYHRFLFTAYSSLRNRYQNALKRKEDDYKELIRRIDQCDEERKLNDLMIDLEGFGEYKNIDEYISLCKRKIEVIKENEKNRLMKKELESRLEESSKSLRKGDYSLAWKQFSSILSDFKNVPYAELGLVMAQLGLNDEEKLANYYKYLFSDIKTETLEACGEDTEHIQEMCERYAIPGYLDADKIRSYYRIDRSFLSETNNRINQRQSIEEEFLMNPYLSKAIDSGDERIRLFFENILLAYDERINEAKKTDELKRKSICDIYQFYLKESDRRVAELYERKLKEKKDTEERNYQNNIHRFNDEPDKAELESLIRSFDKDYKDGNYYIEQCRKRLENLEKERKENDYSYNYENGIRNFNENRFEEAKRYFSACLKLDPENEKLHLYSLMADTGSNNVEGLFDYYKTLYSDKVYIPKEAVEENFDHIEQISQEFYSIPDYFEKDLVREKYQYDRTYPSLMDCRIRQKKQIEELIKNNPSLSWLNSKGSDSIKEKIKDLINVYDDRIKEASNADAENINKVKERYLTFLDEKDEELKALYQGLTRTKEPVEKKAQPPEEKKERTVSVAGLAKKEETPVPKVEKKQEITNKPKTKKWKAFATFGIIAALLFVCAMFYLNNNNESGQYEQAIKLAEEGKYDEAIAIFEQLGDYKESAYYTKQMAYQKADQFYKNGDYYDAIAIFRNLRFNDSEERANSIQKELISKADVNDYVFFGSYEQDNNTTNGTEPIEWIVLEKQSGKILLFSRYGLDLQKFSDSSTEGVSWENSLIRTWLNGTFIDEAFNKEDLNEILQTTLLNTQLSFDEDAEITNTEEVDPEEGKQTALFQKTRDRVFLLNQEEVETYLPDADSRICKSSEYASNEANGWWLRSADSEKNGTIQIVLNEDGSFEDVSCEENNIVRPAIWIKTY